MKRKIIYILVICLICTSVSACQPTLKSSAVANKGNMNLEEGIQKTAEPSKNSKRGTMKNNMVLI